MKIPSKKLANGFSLPVLGLGTWTMGGKETYGIKRDDKADINAILQAIELGITHIDTAESYNNEERIYAEELIGQAIAGYDRKKMCLVSKVGRYHLRYDEVIEALHKSLQRLQTDYLDLYLIHQHNPALPLGETMRALDDLVKEGLIKAIGVSNFLPKYLEEAQSKTKNKIVCNQVHYNLIFREPERTGLLDYCQKNDIFLEAFRPIERGQLTVPTNGLFEELSEKYGKTPSQIAINWIISQDHCVTIFKSRSKSHIIENLGALGWKMSEEDIERLREKFPNQQDASDTVPLG